MAENPSSSEGQAPTSGSPLAGAPAQPTPAVSSPTQQRPVLTFSTPEEAIAFAERTLKDRQEANAEAQRERQARKTLEARLEQLEAQNKAAQQRAIASEVQFQAKSLGFRNPNLVYAAVQAQLKLGEDGLPTNTKDVLEALRASDSYLVEAEGFAGQQPLSGQQPAQNPPAIPQLPAQQARTGMMNAPRSQTTAGLTDEQVRGITTEQWVRMSEEERIRYREYIAQNMTKK